MKATVQSALLEDRPVLNTISVASKRYWNYPEDWIQHWLPVLQIEPEAFEEQDIFKLVYRDEIVGWCSVETRPDSYEVMNLWILPAYIGRGWGWRLLEECLDRVVTDERPIIVEADPNAEAFYARQGFRTFDKVESYPKGRFLPLMRRESVA